MLSSYFEMKNMHRIPYQFLNTGRLLVSLDIMVSCQNLKVKQNLTVVDMTRNVCLQIGLGLITHNLATTFSLDPCTICFKVI